MDRFSIYAKAVRNLGLQGFVQRRAARRAALGATSAIATRHSAHPLLVRGGASDILVFDQIFVDREYRCLDGLDNVRTIVDAGANAGFSSAYLLTRFPEAKIVCIEPDAGNFEHMQRNLAPFGSRVTALHAALWSRCGRLDFREETSGIGDEWGRQVDVAPDGAGDVLALDMPEVMRFCGIGSIDLLKIDIEGAEESVFDAPDLSWLDAVRNIVIELHGESCSAAFMKAIDRRGYQVSRCDELTVCLSPARPMS